MEITKIDLEIFRGDATSSESSAYVAVNPSSSPGSLVLGCATAVRESLGSQVGCKLTLEHFVDGVLEYFARPQSATAESTEGVTISASVLERAIERSNRAVHEFGTKMAASGRVAASFLGLVVQDSTMAAARVGGGSAFLLRSGVLFPFFANEAEESAPTDSASLKFDRASSGELIGTHPAVAVQLATVAVEPLDLVLVFSTQPTPQELENLEIALGKAYPLLENGVSADRYPTRVGIEGVVRTAFVNWDSLSLAAAARIGPQAIYLKELAV